MTEGALRTFAPVLASCTESTDFSIRTKIWSYGTKCYQAMLGFYHWKKEITFSHAFLDDTIDSRFVRYISSEKDISLRVYLQLLHNMSVSLSKC